MDVRFAEVELERLFYIQSFTAGYDDAVVRGYREAVQIIAAARDVQDLCNWQSLRFVAPPTQAAGRGRCNCPARGVWSCNLQGTRRRPALSSWPSKIPYRCPPRENHEQKQGSRRRLSARRVHPQGAGSAGLVPGG